MTCNSYLKKGKIPPMSHKNSLQLLDITGYGELHLTEAENCMISLNIIFQKLVKLPKSRWPAMKDRTKNIPIFESDVIKTIESLPRTLNEAGIIPVNLRRRLSQKNSHLIQYISVPTLIKALETLKYLGNRYYQFVPNLQDFKDKCRLNDQDSYRLLFPEEVEIDSCEQQLQEPPVGFSIEDEVLPDIDSVNNENDPDEDKDEVDYILNDPVKKWQFNYNSSICFADNYPEIKFSEDYSKNFSIAPGEGKVPTNLLHEKDWDIRTFPCLLPDGLNSLHAERKVKLSDQDYLVQRIMNKDSRFAQNAAFIFASVAFIEQKQIQRNIGIAFNRGKAKIDNTGNTIYSLDDP